MIPLPELVVELLLGLGLALFGANLWVLVRPLVQRSTGGRPVPKPPSTTRVFLNMILGGLVALWALATLLFRG